MDSGLNESLIQVAQPLSSETARQRWRRLWRLLKDRKPSKEKLGLRVAVLSLCANFQFSDANFQFLGAYSQFFNEIDNLVPGGQDEEQTEEANIPSSAMPSESDHSASDSDGQGIISQTQTALEIGADSYGSDPNPNRSPFNSTGHDSTMEQGLLTPPLSNDGTRVSVWIFPATGLALEAASAFFDQVSTPQKPQYSLYGMLLSIGAVHVCILEVIHSARARARMQREVGLVSESNIIHNAQIQSQGELASASNLLWAILPEIFGLALACMQCISSALQFSFLCRHAANPVKISLVPFLVFFILFAFKYSAGRNRG